MLPDLSGLSQEEAALITDVLSRLSIGSAQPSTQGLQVQPTRGGLQDQSLLELDLAAWSIEQELRGLQATAPATTFLGGPVTGLTAFAAAPPHPANAGTAFPGQLTLPVGAYSSAHFGGVISSASADVALLSSWHGSHMPAAPTPLSPWESTGGAQATATPVQAASPELPSSSTDDEARSTVQAPDNNAPWSVRQDASANHLSGDVGGTISQPAQALEPERTTSLLKEMRERLRQQQQQQQNQQAAAQILAEPASGTAVKSFSGSVSLHTPEAVQTPGPQSSKSIGQHVRVTYSPATHGSRNPNAFGSHHRCAPLSAPSSASKAFTMLNARTSTERYGPEPGLCDTGSPAPAKAPVKLPDQERSARLQQLYERSLQWRRRCDERYAKARHDREASELQGCTFTPKITTASHLIAKGKSPSEAYQELSKSSTPTKHQRQGVQDKQLSPIGGAAACVTPTRGTGPAGNNARRPLSGSSSAVGDRSHGMGKSSGVVAAPVAEASSAAANAQAAVASPAKPMVNGAYVGERLYRRAFVQRARQEERIFRQLLEEDRQRRFTALVQDVSPRVYDPPEPPSSRYLPTGMEECTFHPSLASSSVRRPKSAPHMRPGDGQSLSSRSHLRYDNAGEVGGDQRGESPAHSQPDTHGAGAPDVHMTVSIAPDLSWEEFLARQERFLASREYKMHLLEQGQPAMPRMSPGSKKLLREREMRQACVEGELMSGPGEVSPRTGTSGSPGRRDRRMRAIMEMYKECTFQPQITRRAAAMPSRKVEDLVDGGRARREEWMEQQRALQQVREVEGATFKPQTLSNAYPHVRPRISLKNPEAYLAHLADKRRQREALRAELATEREALELQHCTFKPQTTPLPAYLIRRLQEQHWQQLQEAERTSSADWDEAYDAGPDTDQMDGFSYDEGYAMGSSEDQSSMFGSQAVVSGCASMPPDEDVHLRMPDFESYQDAYKRALQYAKTQDL